MTQPEFKIQGQTYPRVKYGDEPTDWGASTQPCSSCGVPAGEIHHAGCFVERCPKCQGQAVSCRCEYQETFVRHSISPGRQVFYKLVYLAFVPMGLIAAALWWVPLPPVAYAAAVIGVPVALTALFWTRLGDMELHQLITTRKDGS